MRYFIICLFICLSVAELESDPELDAAIEDLLNDEYDVMVVGCEGESCEMPEQQVGEFVMFGSFLEEVITQCKKGSISLVKLSLAFEKWCRDYPDFKLSDDLLGITTRELRNYNYKIDDGRVLNVCPNIHSSFIRRNPRVMMLLK